MKYNIYVVGSSLNIWGERYIMADNFFCAYKVSIQNYLFFLSFMSITMVSYHADKASECIRIFDNNWPLLPFMLLVKEKNPVITLLYKVQHIKII